MSFFTFCEIEAARREMDRNLISVPGDWKSIEMHSASVDFTTSHLKLWPRPGAHLPMGGYRCCQISPDEIDQSLLFHSQLRDFMYERPRYSMSSTLRGSKLPKL